MKKIVPVFLIVAAVMLSLLSYGFIDPHLRFGTGPIYTSIQEYLITVVYTKSHIAAVIYTALVVLLFAGYGMMLITSRKEKVNAVPRWVPWVIGILLFSYPAFSYDIYNYMVTAKVAFFYRENPYVVMPIEIPNEPMLSYTRAANKLALYGPTWIVLTSFPFLAGMGNTLATIFSFKAFVALFYGAITYLIYRKTKRWDQALFFALHPLVLIETLVSGHNDVVMMALALSGVLLWHRPDWKRKAAGMILFASSVLVKGATIALLPLFFLPAVPWEKKMRIGFFLMFGVFLLSPLREEMYPWYAVWWLTFLAYIPRQKNSFIHEFSYWFAVGLMLRYIPWIATREYGGVTPVARVIVTMVPVGVFLVLRYKAMLLRALRRLRRRI